MFGFLAKKIFGTRNDRILKDIKPIVEKINSLESNFKSKLDPELQSFSLELSQRLQKGESLDALLPEAFALVRESSRRVLGMRHFDTQLIGGISLHWGKISEMKTGEGKTLVATLPAYLNAISGKGVHIVTVNDYLAKRDAEWMGRLFNFLGLSVGCVLPGMKEEQKRVAYNADITYGQNNEFGFDYLRDNMTFSKKRMVQRGHNYAIVDEVDSILIDEARTPLIISGPAEDSADLYLSVNAIIPRLQAEKDFQIELRSKQPNLTEDGVAKVEKLLKVDNLYDPNNIELLHHVTNALKAHTVMEIDKDYVVRDGKVIIVDEFTGRLMDGRRWSNGLHQAVEAKEGVPIARENQTLASITFQNYFRMYSKLSGMTGTADTEAVEFQEIYKLEVVLIPTNRDMVRIDESDRIFRTKKDKYEAVVKDIEEIHSNGQPVLVGTISIEQSETLSKMLQRKGIPHNVLNAKQHEREAEIVAQAGRFKAVTISTNMAGRGTDILLGGNPEFLASAEAGTKDRADTKFQSSLEKWISICADEKKKVVEAGGLCILGTERHESRRIDNQLRGRSGRQGDPGRSRFYVSLEDDLMSRFGGDKIKMIMQRVGWEEGLAIDGRAVSYSVETAQKRVEAFHFEARKHVTDYDDVMNKQRQVVYNLRGRILTGDEIKQEIFELMDDLIEHSVFETCDERSKPLEWDFDALAKRISYICGAEFSINKDSEINQQNIFDQARSFAHALYENRSELATSRLKELQEIITSSGDENSPRVQYNFEQQILLETLDQAWNSHLHEMDHLREGIGLRGYGQKNPLHEYQKEGFKMFQQMIEDFKETAIRRLFFYQVPEPAELAEQIQAEQKRREEAQKRMRLVHDGEEEAESSADDGSKLSVEEKRAKMAANRKADRRSSR
jgi:preprotein translocase subunit SecA